jgi:hypothetical protein
LGFSWSGADARRGDSGLSSPKRVGKSVLRRDVGDEGGKSCFLPRGGGGGGGACAERRLFATEVVEGGGAGGSGCCWESLERRGCCMSKEVTEVSESFRLGRGGGGFVVSEEVGGGGAG